MPRIWERTPKYWNDSHKKREREREREERERREREKREREERERREREKREREREREREKREREERERERERHQAVFQALKDCQAVLNIVWTLNIYRMTQAKVVHGTAVQGGRKIRSFVIFLIVIHSKTIWFMMIYANSSFPHLSLEFSNNLVRMGFWTRTNKTGFRLTHVYLILQPHLLQNFLSDTALNRSNPYFCTGNLSLS